MKNFGHWPLRIVVGLVAVLLLGHVVSGLVGMAQVRGAKGDARESVRVLERDTGTTDQIVQDHRAALGQPQRSWTQVVCRITSSDSGWAANDNTQTCARQVVDVYPASLQDQADDLEDVSGGVEVAECEASQCTEPVGAEPTAGYRSSVGTEPVWETRGEIDGNDDHVIVTVVGPVSHTVLGCRPWGIVVCKPPVDQPVMPEG